MKITRIILLGLFVLYACSKPLDPSSVCRISGTFEPAFQEHLAFTYAEFLDSSRIDQNGQFEIDVPVEEPGYGMLMYNNGLLNVYVEAGKNLSINVTGNNFPDNIEFEGSLGPINHYLHLERKLETRTKISSEDLYSKEPEDFSLYTDSIRRLKTKLLGEYVAKYPEIDSNFTRKRSADILYTWASQQLLYPGYYTIVKNQIPALPDSYHHKYLEELDLESPELLISPIYKTFLQNYLDYREAVYLENNPEVKKVWFPGSVSRFRVIHEEFTNEEIKNYLLYISINDHLDNFGTEHIESFITNFRISCTNEEYKALVEEKYSTSEVLARGNPAPELDFFDTDGIKVKLSELKGRLLYLNFWASWSEWSIQEFPYWEKLRNDFDGYEVDFISVSMDFMTDKNKWVYIVDKQKLGGTQLIHDPESNSFKEQYFINDLPRYLLIDPQGNIISAHAPRPSENMELVLKNLLNKRPWLSDN